MMPEGAIDDSSNLPDANVAQQHSHQVSDFLLDLKEKNAFIAFQALLDSVDLWNSCIKYYCDILNPESSRASAQMMIDILATPEGAAFFFVGSLLFGAFAFLGNYANALDTENSTISYLADAYWPYVRDCIKGVKWTYKGMRSVFLVGQVIYTQLSIALIVPLGVTFGVISAINRFWNRSMVERRKELQNTNDEFREHIKSINACYMEFSKLPSDWELKTIYPGSLLKIGDVYWHISPDGTKEQVNNLSEEEIEVLKFNITGALGGRVDWFCFKTFLTTNPNAIPENSILHRLCEEKKEFLKQISEQKNIALNRQSELVTAGLITLDNWPSESDLRYFYQGCIVKKDGEFYVIDFEEADGKRGLILTEAEKEFLNAQPSNISIAHLQEKLEASNLPDNSQLFDVLDKRQILSARSQRYNEIVGRPQFQDDAFKAMCSAALSGVLNAPYYFLGILSMVTLPYTAFIGAVVACSAFMILNVVAELYQESEYQRRLKVSELKARMSMIKRLIRTELHLINDILDEERESSGLDDSARDLYINALQKILIQIAPGQQLTTLAAFLETVKNSDTNDLTPEQLALIQHLQNRQSYHDEFRATKKLLHDELVLSDQLLVMQGIRNGLYCYGIANGFLMTLAVMSFFGLFAFTPALFWASIGFGFFCLAAGITYTVIYSKELTEVDYSTQPNNDTRLKIDEQLQHEDLQNIEPDIVQDGVELEEPLLATRHYYYEDQVSDECMNKTNDDIKQTRNLMISDQCEVARQFISGNKKGFKLLQTLSIFLPALAANSSSGATQLIYLGVGLTYGVFFSFKGLRNLVRAEEYKDSSLWKILTFADNKVDVQQSEQSVLANSFTHAFSQSRQNLQQASLPASPVARAGNLELYLGGGLLI